jgi:hypothetical protein
MRKIIFAQIHVSGLFSGLLLFNCYESIELCGWCVIVQATLLHIEFYALLAIAICMELQFSQHLATSLDFAETFSVAFHQYKTSGAMDTVRNVIRTAFEGKVGRLGSSTPERLLKIIRENRLRHGVVSFF